MEDNFPNSKQIYWFRESSAISGFDRSAYLDLTVRFEPVNNTTCFWKKSTVKTVAVQAAEKRNDEEGKIRVEVN